MQHTAGFYGGDLIGIERRTPQHEVADLHIDAAYLNIAEKSSIVGCRGKHAIHISIGLACSMVVRDEQRMPSAIGYGCGKSEGLHTAAKAKAGECARLRGADTDGESIGTKSCFGSGSEKLGTFEVHTAAGLANGSRLSGCQRIEQRRHKSTHEQGVSLLRWVIHIPRNLIAVCPLTIALTIVQRAQEIDGRDTPRLHFEIHTLDISIVGGVVVAARVVVGGNDILALLLEQFNQTVHIVLPPVVDGLLVGRSVQALVAKTQTDDYILTAVAQEVPLVASQQIGGIIAVHRGVGIRIVGEQLPQLVGIAVLDITLLRSTLSVADRRTEEGNLVVRNTQALNGIGEIAHIKRNLLSAVPHGDVAQRERSQRLVRLVADHALDAVAGLNGEIPRRVEAELPTLHVGACIGDQIEGIAPYAVTPIGHGIAGGIPSDGSDIAHDTATSDLLVLRLQRIGIEANAINTRLVGNRAAIQHRTLSRLERDGAVLGQATECLEILALGLAVFGDTIHINGMVLNACTLEVEMLVFDHHRRRDARKLLHTHTVDGQVLAARTLGHINRNFARSIGENRVAEIDLTHILIDTRATDIGTCHRERTRCGGQPLDVVLRHARIGSTTATENLELISLGLVQAAQHETATLRIAGKEVVARGVGYCQIAQLIGIRRSPTACAIAEEQIARIGKVQRSGSIRRGNQRIVGGAADTPRRSGDLSTYIVPIVAIAIRIDDGSRILATYHAKIEIERAFQRLLRRQSQRRERKKCNQK